VGALARKVHHAVVDNPVRRARSVTFMTFGSASRAMKTLPRGRAVIRRVGVGRAAPLVRR
jgi:hypothetical protein